MYLLCAGACASVFYTDYYNTIFLKPWLFYVNLDFKNIVLNAIYLKIGVWGSTLKLCAQGKGLTHLVESQSWITESFSEKVFSVLRPKRSQQEKAWQWEGNDGPSTWREEARSSTRCRVVWWTKLLSHYYHNQFPFMELAICTLTPASGHCEHFID